MLPRRLVRSIGTPLALAAVVTASAPGLLHITVHRGDTLTAIAKRYHTTVKALVALNHLPGNGNLILAGQRLAVPAPARAATATRTTTYTVRSGDTASGIAARTSTTIRWLAAHNKLGPRYMIYVGQKLTVPGSSHATSRNSFAGRTYPAATVAAADRNRAWLASHPVASRDTVRALIAATARRYHVDPRLALAISYQESGFQMRVVSPADAIGAMQVIPASGDYVSRYVVHRRLNLLNARDNVTAGVVLLAQLVHATRSSSTAAAAYYQGLGSVRQHGMFADTKAYVRNVLALRSRF